MDIKREMTFSGGYEYALLSLLEGWVNNAGNSGATFSKLIPILKKAGLVQCGGNDGITDCGCCLSCFKIELMGTTT